MKKLNRLFAILISVLGMSATAKADTSILQASDGWQKITALPGNLGDYYYVFVDNGKNLMMTLGAGVHQGGEFKTMFYKASSNPVADLNKVWTLEPNTGKGNVSIRNVAYDHLCLQTEWNAAWNFRTHDNGGTNTGVNVSWTGFTLAYASNKWSIQNGNYPEAGYVGPWDNNIVDGAEVAANKGGNTIGYFQVYAISKADFHNLYVKANTTEGEEINLDMSVFVGNPKIEGNGALWSSTTGCGCNYTTNKQDGTTGGFLENWSGSGPVGKVYQTLTGLPNGVYELKMKAFRNNDISGKNGVEDAVYVFANNDQTQVTTNDVTTYYTVRTTLTNGTLEFGLRQETQGSQWIGLDEVSLTYFGVDLSELKASVQATYNELQGLSKDAVPSAFASIMQGRLDMYKTLPNTESGLTAANNDLKDLIAAYHLVNSEYTKLQALSTSCENIVSNSQETTNGAKATFTAAINTAKTNVESATTADAINGIYNTLETARQTYVGVAEPLNGIKFDYTFMVVNPKFDEGTKGWAFDTGAPNNGIATNQGGAITGNYFENWKWESYTGEIYQELTGLPSGRYILTAAAFRDQLITDATDGDAVYVFANDAETLVNAATPAFYSVEVSITAGTLRFGVRSKVVKYRWMGIDNVSLEYVEGLGLTEFINAYDAAYAAAVAARDNNDYSNVGGVEKAALLAAIALQPEQTQASYESAIAALQSATAAFTAAKNSYDLLAIEKKTAKGLGMSDALIAETVDNKTGLEALYDLKEAEYVYVTEEFNYPVELEASGWIPEGPVGSLTGQHYDGSNSSSYLEQSSSAWGSSAWEISYKYEKTLPAGKYIFKVAGRRAAGTGTTMGLIVTNVKNSEELGSVNDFPEGDTGLGINKKGETSFDANDPVGFANNGAGRGWQWRYVMFELSSETTVQVAVNAAATTNHQWMSFCGASLQMTEETYLKANMHGLDAPTATAQALVKAVPMGTDKIAALNSALNLPVTTGQELLDKIEALNTAIADANAWVGEYNNAKAPLVAALERFEADYNDAQNGALNHMNKDRWTTAISMAQAAAEAKDVTDSYDGFGTATNNLIAALEAATISIGEYTELKAAIDNAEELGGGDDWGKEPFQKSESAKESFNTTKTEAQTAYNAAEVDGEEVTAVIESLNNAINGVVLNAPKEGQRYYIKVATEGHGKNGNAWLVTLGESGANNLTGYGINANNVVKGYLNQAFIFTQVEGNLYNISIERAEGTVYLTYGALNGSAAGWKNQQIQATTDAEKKGEFKIVPTGKNGILRIFNTIDNNYLDCQGGGAIYTDTGIENEEFAFELATETKVTLALSEVGWATLILPFNATLPEGVKAWSCGEADGETLELVVAESIKANTPYLMSGNPGKYHFSGYGLADKDSYEDGLFRGTYVDYKTTANSNTYVLQNIGGDAAFYLVGEEQGQPTVGAYRCYMVYESAAGAPKFSFGRGGNTTGIEPSTLNSQPSIEIYDLLGRKVNTMEKGGMYIVNGKKVIVK